MKANEKTQPKKRGRPAVGLGFPVQVRLQPKDLAALDAWIAQQPDSKPSRPEAIRIILRSAIY